MNEDQTRSLVTPSAPRRPESALGEILAELWRYKFVIPAIAAMVVAATAFWTLRQQKIYEATATLEYDPHPTLPLGNAVEDVSNRVGGWDSVEFYETQNFILRSRSLAERVARRLRLHQDSDFMNRPAGAPPAPLENAAAKLVGSIKVSQIRDTRVVRISIRDHKPERAQLIANTWIDEYVAKSLEDRLGTSAHALEWLSDQLQNLKRDVEHSELALYKFREQHHSLSASLDERQSMIAGQLQSYSNTFTQIHARRIQTQARLGVLREQLAATADPLILTATWVAEDQELVGLRSKYRDARENLDRLAITYGEAHPQVRAARGTVEVIASLIHSKINSIVSGIEGELREYESAERGVQAALNEVNRDGLALSLEEIDYSRLERERTGKSKLYEVVMERAAQTDLTRALRVANARVIDPAVLPVIPVSPQVRMWVSLGVLGGLVLGVAAALGIAHLDNKVRGPADVESRGVTVLGVMPAVGSEIALGSYGRGRRPKARRRVDSPERDMIVHLEPRSSSAECCRTIRTNITFQSADNPLKTIAITSAMPRDGKTMVALNLATALAQSGQRVLIIDTDLRKPRLHRALKLPSGPGVTSFIAGEAAVDELLLQTEIPGVTLLRCGPIPPNPSELLHTKRFAELISQARSRFDTVIFDSPPLGAVTDPAIISTQVDGTILVVRSGTTTRGGVDAALRQLHGVSARIIGAVLNGVDLTDSNYGSYYAYYRGYYSQDGTSDAPPAPPAPPSAHWT
jgi:succinoglycan biosynthesis transport protein ExoP